VSSFGNNKKQILNIPRNKWNLLKKNTRNNLIVEVIMERDFPQQYSADLVRIFKTISFGTPNVVGSSADYKIMYSADYDLMEKAVVRRRSAKDFQKKILKLNKLGKVVDMKIGEVSQWNLLKKPYIQNGHVRNYNQGDELKHLSALWSAELISHEEFMDGQERLKPHMTAVEFLNNKKALRFGLLRWTSKEVQEGYKELRDKKIIYLEEAFKTKEITKIDFIGWATNKYVEISNIILWTNSAGKGYVTIPGVTKGLKEDMLIYEAEGNYVKVAKRMLSIAKQYSDKSIVDALIEILNSPIGKLYSVVADMEILQDFPEAIKTAKKRKEIDSLRNSFAKLFFPDLKHATPSFKLIPKMTEILQDEMEKALKSSKLLPIPRDYRI